MTRRRLVADLGALLALLLAPLGEARAQTGLFFDEFGASYKATAMGQAFTAVADDYSAAYYNPAGLTQVKWLFENATGYIYAEPRVSARFPDYPPLDIEGQPPSRGIFTGIASSLDLEETVAVFPWFSRFAFGLVSWLNLPEINQYRVGPVASRPHFLRHDMRFQLLALAISMACEVTPWLSIGAGIIPSIESTSVQTNFAAINMRDDPVMGLRLSIHQTAKVFVVPVFGVLLRPPIGGLQDRLAFGVSFRDENKGHHGKGPLNQVIGIEDENGEPITGIYYPTTYTINLISFAPRQLTMGLAIEPIEGLTLASDLVWKQWSRYRTYLEERPDPPFGDTWTPRFGMEYAFDPYLPWESAKAIEKIFLRAGYYFEPTPVGDGLGEDNIFDTAQDVGSAGLCVSIRGGRLLHDLEVFFQYHRLREESRLAFIESVFAFQNEIDASGFLPVEIGGDVWSLGASYTMRY